MQFKKNLQKQHADMNDNVKHCNYGEDCILQCYISTGKH